MGVVSVPTFAAIEIVAAEAGHRLGPWTADGGDAIGAVYTATCITPGCALTIRAVAFSRAPRSFPTCPLVPSKG